MTYYRRPDEKRMIRNNNLKFPLISYYHINKIYGCNFIVDKYKLQDLICLIIINNNLELIEIVCKTLPSSIKSVKDRLYNKYRIDHVDLWDLYIKLSTKRNNKISYSLKNSDCDFLIFKQLIWDFVK